MATQVTVDSRSELYPALLRITVNIVLVSSAVNESHASKNLDLQSSPITVSLFQSHILKQLVHSFCQDTLPTSQTVGYRSPFGRSKQAFETFIMH